MAGAYWHFMIAVQLIEAIEKSGETFRGFESILEHRKTFLAGVQGPDYNFYPGGNRNISSLSHGDTPADIGRTLLRSAQTEKERAFAYGWLMHLTTDNITHPLVNKFICEYFPRQTKNGTDYDAYPLGHHRVEWGIDVFLLQDPVIRSTLPRLQDNLPSASDLSSFVSQAFKEVCDFEFTDAEWKGSIQGMIKYENIFKVVWRLTGRLKDRNPLLQGLKEIGYVAVLMPIAKVIALKSPESGAGVFMPIKPGNDDLMRIRRHNQRVLETFRDFAADDFARLANDTG